MYTVYVPFVIQIIDYEQDTAHMETPKAGGVNNGREYGKHKLETSRIKTILLVDDEQKGTKANEKYHRNVSEIESTSQENVTVIEKEVSEAVKDDKEELTEKSTATKRKPVKPTLDILADDSDEDDDGSILQSGNQNKTQVENLFHSIS